MADVTCRFLLVRGCHCLLVQVCYDNVIRLFYNVLLLVAVMALLVVYRCGFCCGWWFPLSVMLWGM
jgi:hypothetical protein